MNDPSVNSLKFQMDRLERTVGEILPGDVIEFNPEKLPDLISFVVRDHRNRDFLVIPVSGDYPASELAAWSDERLSSAIQALCGPRLPTPRMNESSSPSSSDVQPCASHFPDVDRNTGIVLP